jgi:hypothetical protein
VAALEAEIHQLRNLPLATNPEPRDAREKKPLRALRWGS